MTELTLDEVRNEILGTAGHLLIEGGPGCGKTTLALLRAKNALPALLPEQRVLFLSFSRAAVAQVMQRTAGLLTFSDTELIQVRTFHAFFLDVARGHGRLLTGKPARFITPEREAQRRAEHDGDWGAEATRLAREESLFVFDTLAPLAADLLEGVEDVRRLLSARFPLVIVDEFQDTNRDQWRVISSLGEDSTVVCLADPDQRIFDHLEGVDEHRLTDLHSRFSPRRFDLSGDNFRSPGSGLLGYANAVLRQAPAETPSNLVEWSYGYDPPPEGVVHRAVQVMIDALHGQVVGQPTVAVLTRTNKLAGRVSEALSKSPGSGHAEDVPAVEHVLAWDPELAATSALVVASILEWPSLDRVTAVTSTLRLLIDFYRTKLGKGTTGARSKILTLERALTAIEAGRMPASLCAKRLLAAFDGSLRLAGLPVADWQVARTLLTGSTELEEIAKQSRFVRLLKVTDSLAWALVDAWDGERYRDAADVVRVTLADELLNTVAQDPPPVSVMTMHKSKGKEFDGVVLFEGRHAGQFLGDDAAKQDADRRLLRVALTRARQVVILVRPAGAAPLTPRPTEQSGTTP